MRTASATITTTLTWGSPQKRSHNLIRALKDFVPQSPERPAEVRMSVHQTLRFLPGPRPAM